MMNESGGYSQIFNQNWIEEYSQYSATAKIMQQNGWGSAALSCRSFAQQRSEFSVRDNQQWLHTCFECRKH